MYLLPKLASHVAGISGTYYHTQIVGGDAGLTNFLPGLVLNYDSISAS
jgi:hypothetical protein